jgi:hypothetical protein
MARGRPKTTVEPSLRAWQRRLVTRAGGEKTIARSDSLLRSVDIPQVDNLANIRHLAIAIRDGVNNQATLHECLGVDARHLAYTRVASEMLGFITVGDERRSSLTQLGERLLTTTLGSDEERVVFHWAVTHAPALRPFKSFLSGEGDVGLERLADRVAALTGMARSTAHRRARTLMRWRQQINERARESTPGLGLASMGEEIEQRVAHHNAAAKQRVLDWLGELDPTCFEQRIGELLRAMNHSEVRVVGGSGDGGVDVEAKFRDRWGHESRVVVQAKRWTRTLGRKPVDELLGTLCRTNCAHGILITTSGFSKEARLAAASDDRIRLIDGAQLVDLLAANNVLVGIGKYGELLELAGSKRLADRRRHRNLVVARLPDRRP